MVNERHGIRLRVLVAVAAIVGCASWIILRLLQASGHDLPGSSWIAAALFAVLGFGLIAAGRPVKRLVAGQATRPVHPLYAARVLAMAQAAALGGAALVGWYVAQILLVLPDADIPSQQLRILEVGVLALTAAGLALVGLVVQRWCRLDDDDRVEPPDAGTDVPSR
jgi:Protein of unknown function (DUF3180)